MRNRFLSKLVLLLAFLSLAQAQASSDLGTVNFQTSGNKESQAHFLQGLAALHSFWYDKAADEFRASTAIDPDFAMGYWGEAMTCNHPLWSAPPDVDLARKALSKVKSNAKLSPRERLYIEAVRKLYGPEEKSVRDRAYSLAMHELYQRFPEDNDAAAFYALSLLGTQDILNPNLKDRMQAAAIVMDLYTKEPNHPGAAHYIIHSFDDPDHAILALPAAKRYAQIAPDAHHALHMPSHIFVQLGMWPESAHSNEMAWASSVQWATQTKKSIVAHDFHSLQWLQFSYLQLGQYKKANEALKRMHKLFGELTAKERENSYGRFEYSNMAAAYLIETEEWTSSDRLLIFSNHEDMKISHNFETRGCHLSGPDNGSAIFARGFVAAKLGSSEANEAIDSLRKMRTHSVARNKYREHLLEIQELEIAAVQSQVKKDFVSAIAKMKQASALEEQLPAPSGPPELVKPSHELFGEVLLSAGQTKESKMEFSKSLSRHPNRSRSLLGAARAALALGEKVEALTFYDKLLKQWQGADTEFAERVEAKKYVDANKTGTVL